MDKKYYKVLEPIEIMDCVGGEFLEVTPKDHTKFSMCVVGLLDEQYKAVKFFGWNLPAIKAAIEDEILVEIDASIFNILT